MHSKLASGEDVTLSIDLGLQSVIRSEIQKQIDKFDAIGGAGVLLDIKTGEMLAVASFLISIPTNFRKSMMMPALTGPPKAFMKWDRPLRC